MFEGFTKSVITGIITVGSMFYSTISGVNAEFSGIDVFARGETIYVSAQLENCFSEDLDEIFHTGQPIRIHYKIQLFFEDSDLPFYQQSLFRELTYDVLDRDYSIRHSEAEELLDCETLDTAKILMSSVQGYALLSKDLLNRNEQYYIKITAYMDKIYMPEMDQELNLMFYWNSIKPEISTDIFTAEIFEK